MSKKSHAATWRKPDERMRRRRTPLIAEQSAYCERLAEMSDEELRKECNSKIWLSAYASNNTHSDFHWQCDATYDECRRRGKESIYSEEHAALSGSGR